MKGSLFKIIYIVVRSTRTVIKILYKKLPIGKKLSWIVHPLAPKIFSNPPKATPVHNHQLAGFGNIQASYVAGNPAISIAIVLAIIAAFGPMAFHTINENTQPETARVSTNPHFHIPFEIRIRETEKAPKTKDMASHGRLFPDAIMLNITTTSNRNHNIHVTMFCGTSSTVSITAKESIERNDNTPPIVCKFSFFNS